MNAYGFEKPDKPSIGEKWWHRLTYTGVGYGANLALSIVIWDMFLTGRGRPVLDGVTKSVVNGLSALGVDPKSSQKTAKVAAEMACSTLGGHITMIPVKILEDHAGYVTHQFNKAFDPDYKYKDVEVSWSDDDKAPPLVNPANKNTWGQIFMRRLIGMAVVSASGTMLNKAKLDTPLQENTLNVFKKGVDLTGSQTLKDLTQIPRAERYIKLAALDAYFTAITSMITAFTKNTFGKSRDDFADDALSVDIPGVTLDDPTSLLPDLKKKKHTDSIHPKEVHKPLKKAENFTERLHTEAAQAQNTQPQV